MAFSGWMCLVLGRCFFWKMLGKILENPGAGESMSWISSDFNCFKKSQRHQRPKLWSPERHFSRHPQWWTAGLVQPPGGHSIGAAIMARVVQSWLGSPWWSWVVVVKTGQVIGAEGQCWWWTILNMIKPSICLGTMMYSYDVWYGLDSHILTHPELLWFGSMQARKFFLWITVDLGICDAMWCSIYWCVISPRTPWPTGIS